MSNGAMHYAWQHCDWHRRASGRDANDSQNRRRGMTTAPCCRPGRRFRGRNRCSPRASDCAARVGQNEMIADVVCGGTRWAASMRTVRNAPVLSSWTHPLLHRRHGRALQRTVGARSGTGPCLGSAAAELASRTQLLLRRARGAPHPDACAVVTPNVGVRRVERVALSLPRRAGLACGCVTVVAGVPWFAQLHDIQLEAQVDGRGIVVVDRHDYLAALAQSACFRVSTSHLVVASALH